MKSKIKILLCALVFLVSNNSYADQYLGLIRVTCIPEIPHLIVERQNSHDGVNFLMRVGSESGLGVLKKYGLLSASEFDYTCKLPNGVFRIWGKTPSRQASGMCGGNPRTKINMSKDGKIIIDNVFFEPSCFDSDIDASIGTIDIEGGYSGWDAEAFSTSVLDNNKTSIELWDFARINQEYINCLISDVNFKIPGADYEARKVCNKKVKFVSE